MYVLALFVLLVLLLIGSAFCSSAETAFFSLNPLQIRRIGQKKPEAGTRIHAIVSNPTRLLSSILIGNTIVNVAASAVGYRLADHFFQSHGEQIAIPTMTIIIIIFGEIGPKRIGLFLSCNLATLYYRAVEMLAVITTPLRIVLDKITHQLEHYFRPHGRTLSAEEFETVVDISGEEGILNGDELAMIKSIIRLDDLHASDVMTPRVDLLGIDLSSDPATWADIARKSQVNYLLLYRDQIDDVEGFLDIRRFLLDPQHRIEAAKMPPYFVPETVTLGRLLPQLQAERRRIAVVADEYGGIAGVVTRGDILEEISGEIYNELSKPRALFQAAGPNRWLVDAEISLADINRKLGLNLEAEGVDRLAGWIASQIGHLPERDDVVKAQGCQATVMQMLKRRVTLVMMEKLEEEPA